MRSVCISHHELPGTSPLFADYLYRFDRVSRFYAHDPHDLTSYRRAAARVQVEDGRRQRLVTALRRINGDSAALDQLELPDTVAVVTGQQVGLFGGPAYTVYKALTAARLARELNESGIRAVPVFWLATEDHDFAEVRDAWLFDSGHRPVRVTVDAAPAAGQPVGSVEIASAPLDQVRNALGGALYADEVLSLLEETYQPGRTLGEAFRGLLQRLLAGSGVVFFDPLDPEIRNLASPLLLEALERSPELSAGILDRNRELQAAGYHAQVHFEAQTSFFFRLQDGARIQLRRNGDGYLQGTRHVAVEELAADPACLSPNALLRPVLQDYLLPTVAYVGGPAELAYLAQSQVLYQALLGRAPVALPRAGFTLLDERSAKQMARFELRLSDVLHGEDALKQRIGHRLIPAHLDAAFEEASGGVREHLDRLEGELRSFDITLAEALRKSRAKIAFQLDKNRRKAAREALHREGRIEQTSQSLSGLIFPNKHLQERLYSILPFVARHGFDLIDTLYANVHSGCQDHHQLTL